jgi:hypothetical protein
MPVCFANTDANHGAELWQFLSGVFGMAEARAQGPLHVLAIAKLR